MILFLKKERKKREAYLPIASHNPTTATKRPNNHTPHVAVAWRPVNPQISNNIPKTTCIHPAVLFAIFFYPLSIV